MEKRIEVKIYSASPDFVSFAHMRIGWDATWARAGEECFGDALVSRCLTACSVAFVRAVDPKT